MNIHDATDTTEDGTRKRSKTSVACVACRDRKSKCSGGPLPCDSCVKSCTECIFRPETDMRRRDAQRHPERYKTLLDSFIDSIRRGDAKRSKLLYCEMRSIDDSGVLAKIAGSYALVVGTDFQVLDESIGDATPLKAKTTNTNAPLTLPTTNYFEAGAQLDQVPEIIHLRPPPYKMDSNMVNLSGLLVPTSSDVLERLSNASLTWEGCYRDASCQTERVHTPSPPSGQMSNDRTDNLAVEEKPVGSFRELQQCWKDIELSKLTKQTAALKLPNCARDPWLIAAGDPMSAAILTFRDGARRALQSGANLQHVLGTATPCLDGFLYPNTNKTMYSVWSWACQFAQTFSEQPLPLRLGIVYVAGIQMRFYTSPCENTFADLPPILRPMQKQYTVPHAAGVDFCHIPALKGLLFSRWDMHDDLLMQLVTDQDCHWPYSDAACLQPEHGVRGQTIMSCAFLEHIRNLDNYTLGHRVLARVQHFSSGG